MVQKSVFKNWHIEAYLEGRLEEIPEHLLPIVKDIAERRIKQLAKNSVALVPFEKAMELFDDEEPS